MMGQGLAALRGRGERTELAGIIAMFEKKPLSPLSKSTDPGLCYQTQRAAIYFSLQMIFILDSLNVQKPSTE